MPTKPGEARREEDWQSFLQQVKPLAASKRTNRVMPAQPAKPVAGSGAGGGEGTAKALHPHALASHLQPPSLSPSPFSIGSTASLPARPKPTDRLRDIDRRNWVKLKRGEWPIDMTIDLHGCTLESAHQQLVQRLCDAWQAHHRCVLVVTGMGRRSPSGIGAIKQSLPIWIQESPLADKVLAYCPAQLHHGGAGAVYLLLRRQRLPRTEPND
jgi:DNA-nicking Smr family endonuclease